MPIFGLRNTKNGKVLSILGATHASDDSANQSTSSRRHIEIESEIVVGDYGRQPLFATDDLDLVRFLLATGEGNEFHNRISLRPSFDMSLKDVEVIDLSTMQAVVPDPPSEELQAAIQSYLEAATRQ